MMFLRLLLELGAFAIANANLQDKVCIVGAGPSGLSAALHLHDKGYKHTVVFEKEDSIGGKVQNWVDPDGHVHNKGAGFYSPSYYPETKKLLERFGLIPSLVDWPVPNSTYFYNAQVKVSIDRSYLPQPDPVEFGSQLTTYATLYAGFAQYFVPGFPKGVPSELSVPTLEFLTVNKLLLLAPLFHLSIVASGYGSLADTPAIYMLQISHPSLFLGAAQGNWDLKFVNYEVLFQHVADASGADIHLNTGIHDIDYHRQNNMIVKYRQNGLPQTQMCNHLIHAIPYNSDDDSTFGFDDRQKDIFHQLVYESYYTSFAKMSNFQFRERYFPALHLSATDLEYGEAKGVGEPIFMIKEDEVKEYANLYSWHKRPVPSDLSTAQVDLQTHAYLDFLGLNGDDGQGNPNPIEIEATFEWRYFSHVNSTTIKSGWFTDLEALQGHRRTYFTGSYRSFEMIESVVQSAQDIVDRYF